LSVASPLALAVLTPEAAERERWLSRRRRAGGGRFGALNVSLTPLPVHTIRARASSWQPIALSLGGSPACAFIPAGILAAFFRTGAQALDPAALDAEARGVVLEHLVAPILGQMAESGFPPVRVISVGAPQPEPPAADIAFDLTIQNLRCALMLSAGQADLVGVRDYVDFLSLAPHDRSGLPAQVALRVGHTSLTGGELARLGEGDGIVFDETCLLERSVVAVVGERFAQICTVDDDVIGLQGPLCVRPAPVLKSWLARSDMTFGPDDRLTAEPGSIRDVPVKLVFELGRVEMTLGEIELLGEGYVFDLGRPASNVVDIVAGGRSIGSGELVKIGESVGVRVTRLTK
jgi:type III secretion protein Q